MTSSPRIIITRPLTGDPIARFNKAGFGNVWMYSHDRKMSRAELLESIVGAHAVVATPMDTLINHEFFDAAGPQLRIVSNYAVGVDNIDLAEAARRNVIVGHTPDAVTEPTADVAMLLLLAAAKRAHEGNALVRSGEWVGVGPRQLLGQRVVGKTLFIIGAGRIGRAVAKRAVGFDLNILYHSRTMNDVFERSPLKARRVSLEEGLASADFVSLHLPLNDQTHHLIDAKRIALMKPTAILINTARGAIVDEAALTEALRANRIAAAGLDVFEREPHVSEELRALDNAFFLPHAGTATQEDRAWMMEMAVDNAIAALNGEPVPHAVSLP